MPIREYKNMRKARPIEKVQKPFFSEPAKETSVPLEVISKYQFNDTRSERGGRSWNM